MEEFSAAAGQIHMLFADEDEHYTDSLVRLERKQYINYCLQKAGYQGIYFIEKQLTGKGGYRVFMGSQTAADAYCYQTPPGIWLFGKKTVQRETEGKQILCRHNTQEEVTGRILYMLKNQSSISQAFVMEPGVFAELYQENVSREQLKKVLEAIKNSIFLLVSSMKADESFPIFTEKKEVFGGTLFPELENLSALGEHFRLYEELKNELGNCFHVWNQMAREELQRLFQYLWLTENSWQKVSPEILEQGADFLYHWYHQPELEKPDGLQLPEKTHRNLSELRNVLKNQAGFFRKNDLESEGIRRIEEKPWYPVFTETADVRRLRQGIREIAGQERQRLTWKLGRVTEIMLCPWSDFKKLERTGLQEMLKKMEELKAESCRSSEMAERVLDYLYYSFQSEGRYDSDEIYEMKCECHRAIVQCTVKVAQLEKNCRKYEESIRKNRQEFEKNRRELKEKCDQDPLYAEVFRRMKEGTLEPGVATACQMEISQKKGLLVQIQKAIQMENQYMVNARENIAMQRNSIEKLDLVLKELMAEKNPAILTGIVNRAGVMLREQKSMEQETKKNLKKASSLFEKEESAIEEMDREIWYV